MQTFKNLLPTLLLISAALVPIAGSQVAMADPDSSLTIYNENFAVVRQPVQLNLTDGVNHVTVTGVTAQVEPDSVVLRDPSGAAKLRILEQNYLADPISKDRLLQESVGKTIAFVTKDGTTVMGKIIRAGTAPTPDQENPYYQYQMRMMGMQNYEYTDAVVEVDGKLQFGLPGDPRFDDLGPDAILTPTLDWDLTTDKPGPLTAELAYISEGLTWDASYNLVEPVEGGPLELTAWVTMTNNSGRDFPNTKIKLMAGDITKLNDQNALQPSVETGFFGTGPQQGATEKTFDEYHLYTLNLPTSLRDGETKQVEFAHSGQVQSTTGYTYDGFHVDPQYNGYSDYSNWKEQQDFGLEANHKVWITREFKNSAANGLGIPLPKGTARFYQRDTDGQVEFLGEDDIDHTPTDETITLKTGAAFDVVGDRTQTSFQTNNNGQQQTADESFKITLRNHKSNDVQVRVVEHLWRGSDWTITAKSDAYVKTDSKTIEFLVTVPANGSRDVTYSVHYQW